jgi:Protein of unknown function (DUF1236)
MRISRLALIAAVLAVPSFGYAQYYAPPPSPGPVGGALGGALIGGAVGGPVGAVVGGGLGAGVGSQAGVNPQLPPVPPVAYNGPIAVGAKIPRNGSVPTYFIPNYSHRYAYTDLNGHDVIVNRHTARIVQILP